MVRRALLSTSLLVIFASAGVVTTVSRATGVVHLSASPGPAAVVPAGCNVARPGTFHCFALVNRAATRLSGGSPAGARGYPPQALRQAYHLVSAVRTRGKGQTIAVVDAFDDPKAEADLAVYRKTFHLPACTTQNGCFRKVNEEGRTRPLPPPDAGWAEEISLDLDMVSAACPRCTIVLVEATSNSFKHLGNAEVTASGLASVVTNSYGAVEQPALRRHKYTAPYQQPGTFVLASSGDRGYGEDDTAPQFPAVLPQVTAVGGTSLRRVGAGAGRGWSERAWGSRFFHWGAGSGCSTLFRKPSWQHDNGCGKRMTTDVSAMADPFHGVRVYDTYDGDTGWEVFGGTSAAAPFIAGVVGLAQNGATISPGYLYQHRSALYDVTGGYNDIRAKGDCRLGQTPAYFCNGVRGYDGPTGLGTPNGYRAF